VFRHPPLQRKISNKKSAFSEYKQSTVKYSLGEEARIDDLAIFSPREHSTAVGSLVQNEYAFIRRSGGKFCFAMVKSVRSDRVEGLIMDLYVNEAGSTKSIPVSEWGDYIRLGKPFVVCDPSSVVADLGESKKTSRRHIDPDVNDDNDHRRRMASSGNNCAGRSEFQGGSAPIAGDQKEVNKSHSRRSTIGANITSSDYSKIHHSMKKSSQEYTKHGSTEVQANGSAVPKKRSPAVAVGMNSSEIKSRPREMKPTKSLAKESESLHPHVRYPSDSQKIKGKHNVRESIRTAAAPADYPERHFKPIDKDDQNFAIDEHVHDDPIRQCSENTGTTARSSLRSSIATNHWSSFRQSRMIFNDDVSDEDPDEASVNNDASEDHVSSYVECHIMPIDTSNSKSMLHKAQTEHESEKKSFLPKEKHARQSTSNDIYKDSKEKETKKRHSRRSTVGAGLTESQKFNESQLLSAFAAIQMKSKLEDID
jgi:hypothetical protein